MTTENVQHADHADEHHEPHILPLWTYFRTWLLLVVLTAITVGVSYVDFGPGNLVIALLVATTKATLVAMFFMHLLYDHKFHALIFGFSLIFLGIFIGFTLSDTSARGLADPIEGDRPADVGNPFHETQEQKAFEDDLVMHGFVPSADPGKDPTKLAPPQIPLKQAAAAPTTAPASSAAPAPTSAPASSAMPASAPAAPVQDHPAPPTSRAASSSK
jgi:cytochrome c oxidase subunit 4